MRYKIWLTLWLLIVAACDGGGKATRAESGNVLNLYAWAGLLPQQTVANFERETGIKVNYDTFETDEMLETRLLGGHTGYDVVYPGDVFFEQEMRAGVFQEIPRGPLTNLVNLDADFLRMLALHDPGNAHGLPYTWTTTGLGFNTEQIRERLGTAQPDSWSLLLDPGNARKLQGCGISVLDSPWDVLPSVLLYLGKDANSRNSDDLEAAMQVLMRIRPYVRLITSTGNIEGLANGDRCLVLGYSGDMILADYRARESNTGINVQYIIPREGALLSATVMAVPRDAEHLKNALIWLNYTMRPEVSAALSNTYKFPTGNQKALPQVEAYLRSNTSAFPDALVRERLHVILNVSPEDARRVTRLWSKFRTGS